MADHKYEFVINDQSGYFSGNGTPIPTSAEDTIPTSADSSTVNNSKSTFMEGFGNKLARQSISQMAISPLNQATGGLASPAYGLGRSIIGKAGAAAIGGSVVMMGMAVVNHAIQKLQERIARMEAKASAANERDNVLIRSGERNFATHYTGNVFGVKSATDRR